MYAQIQKQMMLWTSGLVCALGLISFFVLVEPPKSLARTMARTMAKTLARMPVKDLATSLANGNGSLPTSAREPASIPQVQARTSISGAIANEKNQALDLKIPCDGAFKGSALASGVTQIRLIGESCASRLEFASSEIRNVSNGFSATVFFPRKKLFTSDYITLARGENVIHVAHVYKDGTRSERDYVMKRARVDGSAEASASDSN